MDRDFFRDLEFKICEYLGNSNDEKTSGFWCDGILPSHIETDFSIASVNRNRKIVLRAFIGKDGQTEYTVILNAGNKALSRYMRNLDIVGCLPDADKADKYFIDTENREMRIQLDSVSKPVASSFHLAQIVSPSLRMLIPCTFNSFFGHSVIVKEIVCEV